MTEPANHETSRSNAPAEVARNTGAQSRSPSAADTIIGGVLLVGGIAYVVFAVIVLLVSDWNWTTIGWLVAGALGLFVLACVVSGLVEGHVSDDSGRLRPWGRPRRFLMEAPFWTLLVATLVGAALGMKEQPSARGIVLYAMLGFGWGTAASMYWFFQSGWMRTLLRFPYVRNTAISHAVGFGLGAWLTGRPPMLCGWVAVSAFIWGYLRGVLSEKAVIDLGVTRRVLERLMSQQGSSLRAAAIIIHRAVEAHPRDAWLHYARAIVLTSRHPRSLGFPEFYPDYTTREEAITDLNLAIELDNSLTDAWLLRARQKAFFTGAPELGLDLAFGTDNVLADFNEAIRQAPQQADIYFERGLFYEQRLQEYSKAEADFSKSIKLSEATAENLLARGRVRFYQESFDSVIEDMSRVIQLDPDGVAGDAFCFRGEARRALGLLDEAASDFRLAIDARRAWLRQKGMSRDAERSDQEVYDAACSALTLIRQQLTHTS